MEPIDRLFDAALAARANAHAPYSRFPVGAALMTDAGEVFSGCNVENAAYPSGLCAEAGAIAAMAAAGGRRIARLLAVGPDGLPIAPCGTCRQRINEFSTDDTRIYLASDDGSVQAIAFMELLPRAFGPRTLVRPSGKATGHGQ